MPEANWNVNFITGKKKQKVRNSSKKHFLWRFYKTPYLRVSKGASFPALYQQDAKALQNQDKNLKILTAIGFASLVTGEEGGAVFQQPVLRFFHSISISLYFSPYCFIRSNI